MAFSRIAVQARRTYRRYEKIAPAIFFLLGILFDVATLDRIDSWVMIVQQAAYLLVVGLLLGFEYRHQQGLFQPSGRLAGAWEYSEAAVHFLLGALLSAYTIFYFKSASLWNSYGFLLLMGALLVGNEVTRVRGMGLTLRSGMFVLCVVSYFMYTVPILFGKIGVLPFTVALVASFLLCFVLSLSYARGGARKLPLFRQFQVPSAVVHGVFALLYFLQVLPPVPLSVEFMGIYHEVVKEGDRYRLAYTRPFWRFWERGDQTFLAREGDKLFGFASIYSPSGFEEEVKVRWLKHEGRHGWQTQDLIPFRIVGGREQGYRGYTVKENFSLGKWRFQVETSDGREIGRLYFEIVRDSGSGLRPTRTEYR